VYHQQLNSVADTFIQASRTYNSFDLAQPYWDKLTDYAQSGRTLSIDKVLSEIDKGNDELKNCARGLTGI